MHKTNEQLLADLISEIESDLGQGREELGHRAVKIKGLILGRMVEPEERPVPRG